MTGMIFNKNFFNYFLPTRNLFIFFIFLNSFLFLLCLIPDRFLAAQNTNKFVHSSSKANDIKEQTAEISSSELVKYLTKWEKDLLIYFYAPWSPFHRHFNLICDQLNRFFLSKKIDKMMIVKFNCELNQDSKDLCLGLNISNYPTFYFLGYGKFNNFSRLSKFSYFKTKNTFDNLIKYPGDPFVFEKLRDWLRIMRWISVYNRWNTSFNILLKTSIPFISISR